MLNKRSVIMVADDDSDDRLLIKEALEEVGFSGRVRFAKDGVELIDLLRSNVASLPSIILLDLNMPFKDGRETLKELKSHPRWRSIPVVVHSTSDSEEDIRFCYYHGVNTYVLKPKSYERLRDNLREVVDFWFKVAHLPCEELSTTLAQS